MVRHVPARSECAQLADAIKGLVGSSPVCRLTFSSIVSQSSVTVVAQNGNGILEYSSDGTLWQESPTFSAQPSGNRKYYVRERANPACAAAGFVTVGSGGGGGGCNTNWQNTATPPVTLCIDGFVNNYQTDGCNNFKWTSTNVTCNTGCVPGSTVDVSPQVSECFDGFTRIRTTDGCTFGWRTTTTACGNSCVMPTGPEGVTVVPSTCPDGDMANNGSINYGPVVGADRFAFWPTSQSRPTFAQATTLPGNGIVSLNSLTGSSSDREYRLTLYKATDQCYLEKTVIMPATVCVTECELPVFTLSKANPSCGGGASNSDGILIINGLQNGDRYQICEATIFNCTSNYATATPITGSGAVIIKSNVGFSQSEAYKDFSVRVFNGNSECQKTEYIRFDNPCYVQVCVPPSHSTPVGIAATCSGTSHNNDASVSITGLVNVTKYSYSTGGTYSGPAFAMATAISSASLVIPGLAGSANQTQVTVRMWNGLETCFKDTVVDIPGKVCNGTCVAPNFTIGSLIPTCTSGQSNNNGNVSINNIANGTRWQVCEANVFNCQPNYDTATPFTGVGPIAVISNLGFLPNQQSKSFTARIYNGNVNCYSDRQITVQNPCYNVQCCSLGINSIQLTTV